MKHIVSVLLWMGLCGSVLAERETLIKHDDQWNLYSRFDARLTEIDDSSAFLGGLHVGGLLNDRYILGLGGNILLESVDTSSPFLQSLSNTDFWYAGAHLGYTMNPHRLAHVVADVLVGGGSIEVTRASGGSDSSSVFVVEPSISARINVTETFSVGLGLSYRVVSNSDVFELSDSDLSGFAAGLYLHFTEF